MDFDGIESQQGPVFSYITPIEHLRSGNVYHITVWFVVNKPMMVAGKDKFIFLKGERGRGGEMNYI